MSVKESVRCAAATRQGRGAQCRNITVIYSEFCAGHTKHLLDLALKPSGIPGAGRGLFTLKAIKKGATIVVYRGERVTQDEYDKHPSGYGVAIPGGMVIDGRSTQSSLGRYANDCRAGNRRAGQCSGNNAELVYDEKPFKLRIQAVKNIPANREVLVSYGARYWKTHHHTMP